MTTEKITLTIPKNLLKRLKAAAAKDKRSLSNYVALKLAKATERS